MYFSWKHSHRSWNGVKHKQTRVCMKVLFYHVMQFRFRQAASCQTKIRIRKLAIGVISVRHISVFVKLIGSLTDVVDQHCFNTSSDLIGSISVPLYRWCHHFWAFLHVSRSSWRSGDTDTAVSHVRTLQEKTLLLFHALLKILGCFSSIKYLEEKTSKIHFSKIPFYYTLPVDFSSNAYVKRFSPLQHMHQT